MFKKILIANRAEIACRIAKTCRNLNIETIGIYSEADRNAPHKHSVDHAVCIGASESQQSYLNAEKIIEIAKNNAAEAIHPGYGFLSENVDFVKAVTAAGLEFIGPQHNTVALMGDKIKAKELAQNSGVKTVPGVQCSGASDEKNLKTIAKFAKDVGYPILLKAAGGGGGRGMRIVETEKNLAEHYESAQREAQAFFNNPVLLAEKLIVEPKHIEVQLFGDKHGNVLHIFDRDCTLQRNHQKVIEEAPAVDLPKDLQEELRNAAVKMASSANYVGAGTAEFLVDGSGNYYFLEINSRLQVEHPVTEMVTGLDLVELQIRVAAGEKLTDLVTEEVLARPTGHAIELRICAESPENDFTAATGLIDYFEFTPDDNPNSTTRLDFGYGKGDRVSHYYDSLLGKLIVHAESRPAAISATIAALKKLHICGVETNLAFLQRLLCSTEFNSNTHNVHTAIAYKTAREKALLPYALFPIAVLLKNSHAGSPAWKTLNLDLHTAKMHVKIANSSKTAQIELVEKNLFRVSLEEGRANLSIRVSEVETDANNPLRFTYSYNDLKGHCQLLELASGSWLSTDFACFPAKRIFPSLKEHGLDEDKPEHVIASLPGKVISIEVQEGEQVEKNSPLLKLESMKMEHIIRAPEAATISEIPVKAGETIDADTILVRLEY